MSVVLIQLINHQKKHLNHSKLEEVIRDNHIILWLKAADAESTLFFTRANWISNCKFGNWDPIGLRGYKYYNTI